MGDIDRGDEERERAERFAVLEQLEEWLEPVMRVLGFVWLALLVVELTRGLPPLLIGISTAIWALFVADFALRLVLAPEKWAYIRRNWLAAISLAVPPLRVFRVARAVRVLRLTRAVRGTRLVSVVGSLNRGMRALSRSMGRRGMGYAVVLTLLVIAGGAAGMYALEGGGTGALGDYPTALWWTAMVITTLGTDYWPQSAEGRVLCLLLAIYAFAVWGYITASIASYFVGRDAEDASAEVAGQSSIDLLRADIAALRADLRTATGQGHRATSPG